MVHVRSIGFDNGVEEAAIKATVHRVLDPVPEQWTVLVHHGAPERPEPTHWEVRAECGPEFTRIADLFEGDGNRNAETVGSIIAGWRDEWRRLHGGPKQPGTYL